MDRLISFLLTLAVASLRLLGMVSFVLLSLFASGTMAARDSSGGLTVEICGPEGITLVTLGPDGRPVETAADLHCPWAVAHSDIALTPAVSSPLPLAVPLPFGPGGLPPALFRPAHDPRGIWARGPPALI